MIIGISGYFGHKSIFKERTMKDFKSIGYHQGDTMKCVGSTVAVNAWIQIYNKSKGKVDFDIYTLIEVMCTHLNSLKGDPSEGGSPSYFHNELIQLRAKDKKNYTFKIFTAELSSDEV